MDSIGKNSITIAVNHSNIANDDNNNTHFVSFCLKTEGLQNNALFTENNSENTRRKQKFEFLNI